MADRPILFSSAMVSALLAGRKTQTRRILTRNNAEVMGASWRGKSRPWEGLRFGQAIARTKSTWSGAPDPHLAVPFCHPADEPMTSADCGIYAVRPVVEVGDRLWVRETLRLGDDRWRYNADCAQVGLPQSDPRFLEMVAWAHHKEGDTCVSIHMPRWASRLTLTVTEVRVERLQDISEADAIMEGCSAVVGSNWWQGYRDLGDGGALLHQMTPGDAPPEWMIEPKPAGRSAWADKSARDGFRDIWNTINGAGSWDANPWVIALTFTVTHRNIDSAPMPEREERTDARSALSPPVEGE